MSVLDMGDGPAQFRTAAGVIESDGITRARFTPPQPLYWYVYRITVRSDVQGEAYVYVGNPSDYSLVSGTYSGDFDENEAVTPYVVPIGTPFVVEWPSGGNCFARIEYVEMSS